MRRLSALLLVIGALSGCSSGPGGSPWLIERTSSPPSACAPLTHDQELAINLSQDMLDAGRLHASLANLERLPAELPEARLRKARILRLLGRSEAQGLYRGLLGTCLSAQGRHGLGQLAASARRYDEALEHLRVAVSLMPVDDAMRNDLGVVYLNLRQLPQARFELTTAMELNEGDSRAAQNLLTLLLFQGNWSQASELVSARKLTPAQFRDAEQRALSMRSEGRSASAKAPIIKPAVPSGSAVATPAVAGRAGPAPVAPAAVVVTPAPLAIPAVPTAQPPSSALPATVATPVLGRVQRVQPAAVRQVVPITGVE